MVTPFNGHGEVDLDAAAAVATYLVDSGHDCVLVSGTTGESPTTTDEEKVRLLRAVLDAVGDRARVAAGTGSNDTRHSIELAEQAYQAGAHALLVVTPYYNKPTQAGVIAHMTAVADAVDAAVVVYDIPGRTGLALERDTLLKLAAHPRITGVKDASGDLFKVSEVMSRTGLAYYSGDDELNLAHLAQGAVGLVSVVGHVAGRQYRSMIQAVDAGDLATARQIHRQLIPAVRALMRTSQGAIMAKAALKELGVLDNCDMRLPLLPATDDMLKSLRTGLAEAGLSRS